MAALAGHRWDALRALYEGEPATVELLAAASNLSAATILRQAQQRLWARPSENDPDARADKLNRLVDWLIARVEALRDVEPGAALDRTQIDALTGMIRILEKIGEMMRLADSANEKKNKKRDESIAEVLGRIDRRIVELAGAFAERMVAGECRAGSGRADPRRMVDAGAGGPVSAAGAGDGPA